MGSRAAPWYLAGGIPAANCVAAYQAIGAADIATSYVNLVNPGTYNLVAPAAPTWAVDTGWTFDGSTQYMTTGINTGANATQTWSVIMRFSGAAVDTGLAFGGHDGASHYLSIAPRRIGTRRYYNGGLLSIAGGGTTSGIMAIAGLYGYLNGVLDAGSITWAACDLPELHIGACNNVGTPLYLPYVGSIQALAFYNIVLTEAQVGAVTAAMLPL